MYTFLLSTAAKIPAENLKSTALCLELFKVDINAARSTTSVQGHKLLHSLSVQCAMQNEIPLNFEIVIHDGFMPRKLHV